MTDRELMQMALDALEEYVGVVVSVNDPNDWTPKVADAGEPARKAIEALRARLTEHEPYAAQAAMVASQTQGRMYVDPVTGDVGIGTVKPEPEAEVCCQEFDKCLRSCTPRGQWIAHKAAQREWQGLTDEERTFIAWESNNGPECVAMTEAKLKEKNT